MRTTGTRKTHSKTRLGCSQCKRRRIKCDCTHPKCLNCEKKGDDCSFLLLAPSTRLTGGPTFPTSTAAATSPSESSSSSVVSTSPIASSATPPPSAPLGFLLIPTALSRSTGYSVIPPGLRYNDSWKPIRDSLPPELAGIIRHYDYTTNLSLFDADPAKAAWQSFIPELAANHKFLVHNILAIASLHLARLHGSGTERQVMSDLAALQMNKAIARFRPELDNLNAGNAAALFASATFTAVYFFRTATQDMEDVRANVLAGTIVPPAEAVNKMLAATLRTIWGLRGPWTVLIPGWDHVIQGKMSVIANRHWWPSDRIPKSPRAIEEDQRLAEIENLFYGPHQLANTESLRWALFSLRETFALVSQLIPDERNEFPYLTSVDYTLDGETVVQMKDRGAIFVWATRISRDFIRLMEVKNREALVILAHFAVLVGRVRNVWWLEGLGANIIITVAMTIGPENWHLIEWPIQAVGVDLEKAFSARPPNMLEAAPGEMAMDVI